MMAGEVKQIGSATGSFLMRVDFYRLPRGEISAVLQGMPAYVIESEPTISARFTKAAMWAVEGALSLMRQAVRFDEETREAQNDQEAGK
jgi:hypothetical protein